MLDLDKPDEAWLLSNQISDQLLDGPDATSRRVSTRFISERMNTIVARRCINDLIKYIKERAMPLVSRNRSVRNVRTLLLIGTG